MFKVEQLRELIIKPVLRDLVLYSDDAVELLLFTCAVESLGGTFLKQVNGPALGIYQMEPETHNDIWQNFISNHSSRTLIMVSNFDCIRTPSEERMVWDLRYATAMCRLHYARVKDTLPAAKDIDAVWEYYKKYYNTVHGAASKIKALIAYRAFFRA